MKLEINFMETKEMYSFKIAMNVDSAKMNFEKKNDDEC